jgi:hypothetical protein
MADCRLQVLEIREVGLRIVCRGTETDLALNRLSIEDTRSDS